MLLKKKKKTSIRGYPLRRLLYFTLAQQWRNTGYLGVLAVYGNDNHRVSSTKIDNTLSNLQPRGIE